MRLRYYLSTRQKCTPAKRKYPTFYSFSYIKAKTQAKRLNLGILFMILILPIRSDNFSVKAGRRSGRPISENSDNIFELFESGRTVAATIRVNATKSL